MTTGSVAGSKPLATSLFGRTVVVVVTVVVLKTVLRVKVVVFTLVPVFVTVTLTGCLSRAAQLGVGVRGETSRRV